jgi:hypothetical protein
MAIIILCICSSPCSPRGAFRRRSAGGAGRPPRAGSQPALGRSRGSAWGTLRSPRQELADRTAHSRLKSAARESKRAAVERREARRPASSAGDLGRTRDRPDREAGHRVRRFRTQRLSALRPPHCGRQTGRRRTRAPPTTRAAQRWPTTVPARTKRPACIQIALAGVSCTPAAAPPRGGETNGPTMRVVAAACLAILALAAPGAFAQENSPANYETWPVLRSTFPSTGGGIMIKGHVSADPFRSGSNDIFCKGCNRLSAK